MHVTALVLAAILALSFLAAGIPLIVGSAKTLEQADHLSAPPALLKVAGGLQIAGAVGVIIGIWLVSLGVAAGAGLALLMIAAAGAHLRAKDPLTAAAPAAVLAATAVAYVICRILSAWPAVTR